MYVFAGIEICKENIWSERITGALQGIDLEISEGEFTTIFGPSGSGKTTLLNLIGALDKPSLGEALFLGKSINEMTKDELAIHRRHNIGFVFQSFNLIIAFNTCTNSL